MKKSLTRRAFIKHSLQAGAGAALTLGFPAGRTGPLTKAHACGGTAPKVLLISIDSLDPRYLELDRDGGKNGCPGNWLMPNVRAFLDGSVNFTNAKCHMPSATDMNHLNAVAGTHTGENAINLVSVQLYDWESDGTPIVKAPNLSFARDGDGRRVDTLFSAWKRKWPNSKTLYASGKEWVAHMFKTDEVDTGVDCFLTGNDRPAYIAPPPTGYKFYDPSTDADARQDAESLDQKVFSLIGYESNPESFPPDVWVVDASLEVLKRETPDFGVILLAQMDDLQHGLGAGYDPDEFEWEWTLREGYVAKSIYNKSAYREAILDGVRDVDHAFGRLMDGIWQMDTYKDAVIVLYSDHGHITHRGFDDLGEWVVLHSLLDFHHLFTDTDFIHILDQAGLLTEAEKNFKGFCPIMAASVGVLHFQGTMAQRLEKARQVKQALLDHKVWDKYNRQWECPWHVLDLEDMETGVPGVCTPGEVFHDYFGYKNKPGMLHWPDLYLFARNRWQLPVVAGYAANVGIELPEALTDFLAPANAMLGGHGSTDTTGIVMAVSGPGISAGSVDEPARISDIGMTLAEMLGLELRSNTVGRSWASVM